MFHTQCSVIHFAQNLMSKPHLQAQLGESCATFFSEVKFRVCQFHLFLFFFTFLVPYPFFCHPFCTKLNDGASYPGAPWGVLRTLLCRSGIQGAPICSLLSLFCTLICCHQFGTKLNAGASYSDALWGVLRKLLFWSEITGMPIPVFLFCLTRSCYGHSFRYPFCAKLNVGASYTGAPWGVLRNLLFRSEIRDLPIIVFFRVFFLFCSVPLSVYPFL